METEAVSRNATELWGSSPVRRLIDRVGRQFAGTWDGRRPFSAASNRWQDVFWFGDREPTTAGDSSTTTWTGQGHLPYAETKPIASARHAARSAGRSTYIVEVPSGEDEVAASTHVFKARPGQARGVFAQRGHSVKKVEIAKFLQVNRAVHGVESGPGRFALPARAFEAEFQLWKGSDSVTPFLMGC